MDSRFENIAADMSDARTGHFNHPLSTAFEQITGFGFEMLFEKSQGAHQDSAAK